VQRGAAQDTGLELVRVRRIVGVDEVRHVQGPGQRCRLALERAVALALLRPASVQRSVLTKDVGAELASGQVRYDVATIDRRFVGV
jgi:hypothetical protein